MRTWIFQNCRGRNANRETRSNRWAARFARRRVGIALLLSTACPAAAQHLHKPHSADEVITQAREFSRQAMAALPQDRRVIFSHAHDLIGEWVRLQPDDPRALLVRVQAAITSSLEAELLRQDAERATGEKVDRWDAARTVARGAIAQWKTVAGEVKTELLRHPRTGRGDTSRLSAKELSALENNARLQLAVALKNQALCFPADSADRMNSLSQAVQIASSLGRAPDDDTTSASARVEELACRRLLAEVPAAEPAGGANSFEREAQDFSAQGNWRSAITAYDQAVADAAKTGLSEQAFRFALPAAKLAADHGAFDEASLRYRQLALRNPEHPHAADAHLLAIHNAGLAAQAEKPPRFDEYRKLLNEHLQQWPNGKSSALAHWRLGQLCALQADWDAAIDALGKLPPDDPHREESLALIWQCRIRQVADLEFAGKRQEALTLVAPLANQRPHDGALQEQFARILADTTDRTTLKQAAEKWAQVQRRSKPGSPRWFRAAYGLAKTQYDLGHHSQALAFIKLTKSSHPDLGGEELRAKFESLLEACEPANRKPGETHRRSAGRGSPDP